MWKVLDLPKEALLQEAGFEDFWLGGWLVSWLFETGFLCVALAVLELAL